LCSLNYLKNKAILRGIHYVLFSSLISRNFLLPRNKKKKRNITYFISVSFVNRTSFLLHEYSCFHFYWQIMSRNKWNKFDTVWWRDTISLIDTQYNSSIHSLIVTQCYALISNLMDKHNHFKCCKLVQSLFHSW